MSTVPQWTGREIRALRAARRMSVREFAMHLGVSDRMVSKWESGGEAIRPRSLNQAALDTSLASCDPPTRTRFEALAGGAAAQIEGVYPGGKVRNLAHHPVDGKLMTLVEAGPWTGSEAESVWLSGYYIDVLPTTCGDYAQFVANTGHRPPGAWPEGRVAESLTETPVQVSWQDAQAYASWASKEMPTPGQWDRAATGEEGMLACHLPEWCATSRGPRRHQPPSGGGAAQPGFRCVLRVDEMLALLAI